MHPHYKNKAWGWRGPDCRFVSRLVSVCIGPLDAKTTKPAMRCYVTLAGVCMSVERKSFGVSPLRSRATPALGARRPTLRVPASERRRIPGCCCPLGGREALMYSGHDSQPISASCHPLYQGETQTEPVPHQSVCKMKQLAPKRRRSNLENGAMKAPYVELKK